MLTNDKEGLNITYYVGQQISLNISEDGSNSNPFTNLTSLLTPANAILTNNDSLTLIFKNSNESYLLEGLMTITYQLL